MLPRVVAVAAVVACGPKVREVVRETGPTPSREPTLAFLPGTGAVAVGTPIYANVAWDSSCQYGEQLCYQMPQAVDVQCEANACTGKGESGHAFTVTPTKPGSLRGTATLRATRSSYRKSFPLTIEAVIPDGATATCAHQRGESLVTLEITHRGTRVRAVPPELAANGHACEHVPYLDHGWPEPPKDSFRYSCPTQDAQLELVIETPAFALATTSACQT